MAKVLRWFGKNGKRYDYNNDDDNNRTSSPSQYLKTRHKVEWIKQHETSSRGNSWTNSRDFGSIMQYRQEFDQFAWKKHHSLPIPRDKHSYNNNYSYHESNNNHNNIYNVYDEDDYQNNSSPLLEASKKVLTPAKIIVATKENLSRNSRSSIQSIQLHSIKRDTKRFSGNINIINNNHNAINDEINQDKIEIKTIKEDDGVDDNNHSSSSSNHENHNHVRNRNSSNRSSNIPSSNTSNKSLNGIPSSTSNNRNSSSRNSLNKHSLNRDSIRSSISATSSTSHPSSSSAKTTGNERKNIILKRNFARCNTCRKSMMEGGYTTQWCRVCESKRFEQNFGTWTSGNDNIDCFILETQLNAQSREKWDKKTYQYVCCGEWVVALKRLHNSKYVTTDFFNEMSIHLRSENNSGNYFIRYYGITQDPNTKDYMIVEQFARNGNLQSYIKKNRKTLTWQKSGNILIHSLTTTLVSDLGLSSRADKGTSSTNINDISGTEEIFNNNVGGLEEEEEEVVDPGAIYISRFLKFSELQEPTIIFTRTNDPIEHLSVKNHIILETQLCNLKYEILQTENTKVAAEVYEILKYL
ncbi:5862_t:CDS:2 [Entrophospora sp. SA101]|nr:5856_t:CDS:2 [Entrophospora sp. SA101]CAJ0625733.1 5862_t:CDS:2 [Entrophospora sp. SA101]